MVYYVGGRPCDITDSVEGVRRVARGTEIERVERSVKIWTGSHHDNSRGFEELSREVLPEGEY